MMKRRINVSLVFFLFFLFCASPVASIAQQKGNEELFQQRLATLKSPIDLTYHKEVGKYIEAYLANPETTRELIGLSKTYFPMIERSLRMKNVPIEMKYLAVALSGLNPSVQNANGASGVWLMSYQVSKMYKLKVNSFIDERKDPSKSSSAAAAHFKDLHSIYHQWSLAIAAYGCSPVMLNKCMRMAGGSTYFWDIYSFIPEDTRDIYPKFVATAYIFNFYREHGLKPATPETFMETDSVLVNKWLSFQQISSTIDVSVEQLRKLNPLFKKDIIPYNLDGYWIVLPKNKAKSFDLLKDSVYNPLPKPDEFAPVAINKSSEDTTLEKKVSGQTAGTTSGFDKKRVSYTVKKGETLRDIADLFDVSSREIVSWNKLKKDRVRAGQKLTIWVKSSKTGYYKRINSMNSKQKKKIRKKD